MDDGKSDHRNGSYGMKLANPFLSLGKTTIMEEARYRSLEKEKLRLSSYEGSGTTGQSQFSCQTGQVLT